MFITHRPTVTLQLHNFDLFTTCRTSSFCTVAWQLARFQPTRRIARSVGDSWASCWTALGCRGVDTRPSSPCSSSCMDEAVMSDDRDINSVTAARRLCIWPVATHFSMALTSGLTPLTAELNSLRQRGRNYRDLDAHAVCSKLTCRHVQYAAI